jgi:hypothetical protein
VPRSPQEAPSWMAGRGKHACLSRGVAASYGRACSHSIGQRPSRAGRTGTPAGRQRPLLQRLRLLALLAGLVVAPVDLYRSCLRRRRRSSASAARAPRQGLLSPRVSSSDQASTAGASVTSGRPMSPTWPVSGGHPIPGEDLRPDAVLARIRPTPRDSSSLCRAFKRSSSAVCDNGRRPGRGACAPRPPPLSIGGVPCVGEACTSRHLSSPA